MDPREYPPFLEVEAPPPPADKARFHIIPAPYERTVSYGTGTRNGPSAILHASLHLEAFDGVGVPAELGIHTGPPVECAAGDDEAVLERIEDRVTAVAEAGAIPVTFGGEHTVTLAPVRAFRARKVPFGVVQFDAHADLRDVYQDSRLSHGCVMRRIWDLGVPVFQIGVRSLSVPEHEFRIRQRVPHVDAMWVAQEAMPEVTLPSNFPENIYVTFDVDVLDPSIMPGTGTPEPGGLSWYQALHLLRSVMVSRTVIGFDVVELAPVAGSTVSEFTVARLVYAMMGFIVRSKGD